MSLLTIQATIKAEAVPAVEAAAGELFAVLDRLRPDNLATAPAGSPTAGPT
jgi:hypothetical protein